MDTPYKGQNWKNLHNYKGHAGLMVPNEDLHILAIHCEPEDNLIIKDKMCLVDWYQSILHNNGGFAIII